MNRDAKTAIILLLQGIFYKSDNEKAFYELLYNSYSAVSEYFETIGLELVIEENDGYAYLKNRVFEEGEEALPKLIKSRELSYKVSLLCVVLRRKIAEFEVQSEHERAVIGKEDIKGALELFLGTTFNELKMQKEIESTIKKVEDLGFLKKLKTVEEAYEIKPSIKAFVNASWLDDLDKKLQEYKEAKVWS
ncbi:DUF4194 domain-containing protein [Sulfurimonas sediminis]|nr:DUF4194 domain-containing protein [Sulfurimonas sediminis]